MTEEGTRTIKLFCPSLSKVVQLVAPEEQRLDLGSIARTFGLNPSTLKLNGHFISRGVDFIASSVTWKSLFYFFSARGLATGTTGPGPLIVDGKLCKVGSKRARDPAGVENEINCMNEWGNRKPLHEGTNLLKKTRLDTEYDGENYRSAKCDEMSLKRKQWLNVVIPGKKTRMAENNLGLYIGENSLSSALPNMQFPCNLAGKNMKRMREEEMVVTDRCKRIR